LRFQLGETTNQQKILFGIYNWNDIITDLTSHPAKLMAPLR